MIKLAKISDKLEISEYCNEKGFPFPTTNCIYLSKDKDNKINGLAGIEIVVKIEPFIANSSITAKRLYDKLMEILRDNDTKRVECFVMENKMQLKPLYEKLGFKHIEKTNRFIKVL